MTETTVYYHTLNGVSNNTGVGGNRGVGGRGVGGRDKRTGAAAWKGSIDIPKLRVGDPALADGIGNIGDISASTTAVSSMSTTAVRQLQDEGGGEGETITVPLMLLSDDYVLPAEPIVDYVTRFSGLTREDLDPAVSAHAVITHRAAILKLR